MSIIAFKTRFWPWANMEMMGNIIDELIQTVIYICGIGKERVTWSRSYPRIIIWHKNKRIAQVWRSWRWFVCSIIKKRETVLICVWKYRMLSAVMVWFGAKNTIFIESNKGFEIRKLVSVKKKVLWFSFVKIKKLCWNDRIPSTVRFNICCICNNPTNS